MLFRFPSRSKYIPVCIYIIDLGTVLAARNNKNGILPELFFGSVAPRISSHTAIDHNSCGGRTMNLSHMTTGPDSCASMLERSHLGSHTYDETDPGIRFGRLWTPRAGYMHNATLISVYVRSCHVIRFGIGKSFVCRYSFYGPWACQKLLLQYNSIYFIQCFIRCLFSS